VLASVYETKGATYSKVGARMLMTADGQFQGMLSGGCLEGDLAERAKQVVESGQAQKVTYDLGQDDEELWGLGVGCDGLMRIFLQPLVAADDYQPFATISDLLEGDSTEIAATVIESTTDAIGIGATWVRDAGAYAQFGSPSILAKFIEREAEEVLTGGQSTTFCEQSEDGDVTVLYALIKPPPKILVLGAGLDAEPVVNLCAELGWRVTVQDHRPAYIEKGDFSAARQVLCGPAALLPESLDLQQFDAAVVMSHHLVTDRTYLELLAQTDVTYIGLLGPRERRNRIMQDLGDTATRLQDRLNGPAGLDIGGRGPASIALSIVSEMHVKLLDGQS